MADNTPQPAASNETPDPAPATPPEPTGAADGDAQAEPTLTQADVDRIVKERLKRDRQAQESKRLEDLGLESFDDLKTMLDDYRKRKEADMSELEKAQSKIADAEKKAQEAEQRAQALQAEYLAARRREVFLKVVRDNGGHDEDDLYILVTAKHGEDLNAVFGENEATADEAKLKSFIKQVQSDHPAYFGTASAGSPSNAGGIAPNSPEVDNEMRRTMTKKFGRL